MAKKKTSPKKTSAGKTVKTVEPAEFFEILGGKRRILTQSGKLIDLSKGIPADALALYTSGFGYLGLKKGAEVLFEKESNTEIERLIAQATRDEDVAILKKALKK